MMLGWLGAFLLALVVIFIVGNLWFHFVEAILDRIRKFFRGHQEPPAWHPFPPEDEAENKE